MKRCLIVNGAEEAADWEKERGMGLVLHQSPSLNYCTSFFWREALAQETVLGRVFFQWICHQPNLIIFIFIAQVLYELRATIPVPQGRLWGSRTYGTFAYLLHLRVERSGKEDRVNIDKRCVTLCWYACSFIKYEIFSFRVNVILMFLIFSWMCESNRRGLNPNQI